ncbi:MAG: hypothetical protein OEY55_16205 [Acidimicrobiia bacterium]|nr:hypothetical protein [Acidimicrobiia bacterium]
MTPLIAGALLLAACASGPIVGDDYEEASPAAAESIPVVTDGAPSPAPEEPIEEPGEASLAGDEDPVVHDLEDAGEAEEDDLVIEQDEPNPKPEPIEPTPVPTTPPVTGEVPADLLAAIMADAESRSATSAALTVVRAESVTWSDGSLGCPEPGMMYTQALVTGYWVVLDAGGQQMDYRAGTSGSFKYCPLGGTPPTGPSDT